MRKLRQRKVPKVTQSATSEPGSHSQLWLAPKNMLLPLHHIPLKSYFLLVPRVSMILIMEVVPHDLN